MTTFDPMTATNGDLWEIIDALRDMVRAAPLTVERLAEAMWDAEDATMHGGKLPWVHIGQLLRAVLLSRAERILAALAVAPPSASQTDDLGAALDDAIEAMPYKRWTLSLDGDWEDGWVATGASRLVGEMGRLVTTEGQGWGADRGGLSTPAAALRALAAKLRTPQPEPKS